MKGTYPRLADGTGVPFRPSERPPVTAWMRAHILERHQMTTESEREWPRKSKFPGDWDEDRIVSAVELTLAEPDREPVRLGDKIRFERLVDGQFVRVQVRVDKDPPEIWNAYPVDGED